MNTKTKSFSSDMTGLPALSGTAGALIAILDAVLVNGYGSTGVVSLSVTGTVATATYATGHPFKVDTVGLFAGATPPGLNGEKRILTVSANTVTFDATGVVAGAATGTITSKVAAAGWTKLFTGTNLAAYKSLAPESTGCILRVDDTGPYTGRVRGYESMTDVSTGSGPFPTPTQWEAPGLHWSKSTEANASPRKWAVYADHRGFYWLPQPVAGELKQGFYFGDINSNKSNDPYACVLRASTTDRSASPVVSGEDVAYHDAPMNFDGMYAPRAANALGGAVRVGSCLTVAAGMALQQPIGLYGFPYPSPVDNGLSLYPLQVFNPAQGVRGSLPGLYGSNQIVNAAFTDEDVILGTGAMAGKKVKTLMFWNTNSVGNRATLFVTHTDDWRF